MPLIGDELRTILGMMPTRDRAGIARGTMADDAMRSSAAAESGNAEGAALMQQGQRPPMPGPPQIQIPPQMRGGDGAAPQLPEDVPTAFASGRGDGGAPPVPQERVVASGPAAAPPASVATRASDVMIATLEQQAKQQKMMQLVGSLGLIANAFNRNPESQAATRASLAGMIGGGGGGGGGGLADIKTISDMRDKEAAAQGAAEARTSGIGALVKRGLSPAEAAVEYDSGQYKQRIGAEADQKAEERARAVAMRTNLLKPDAVQEIMKRTGMPRFQVEAEIQNGDILKKIDPKELADIADKNAQTAERVQKTGIEAGNIESYENAKNNRAKFMEQYDLSPTAADRALANRPAYDEFVKDRSGAKTAGIQGFEYDRARAKEQGSVALTAFDKKYPDLPTYERLKVPSTVENPEEKARATMLTDRGKRFIEKDEPAARDVEKSISVVNHNAQNLWSDDLITGGGQFSVAEERGRRLAAKLLGYDPKDVTDTQLFFNARKADALKMRGTDMPGAMSDADRDFLLEIQGNRDMSAPTLKRLMMIQEKYQRTLLEKHNEEVRRLKAKNPTTYQDVEEIQQPELGRFHQEALATPGGQRMLQHLRDNPTDKKTVQRFEEEFGKGMAKKYLNEGASGG